MAAARVKFDRYAIFSAGVGNGTRAGIRLLLCIAVACGLSTSFVARARDTDLVWVWNRHCQTPVDISLRVRLDGKSVYATTLQLCRSDRAPEPGKASFQFTAGRPVVWYSYRTDSEDGREDPGDPTPAGTPLTVDFWQASGESDVIVLGYSVVAGNAIHMNSLHTLSPTNTVTTTMAPGLVLETGPKRKT